MKKTFGELSSLFFATRQLIRAWFPGKGSSDPNAWMRCETLKFISYAGDPTMHDIAGFLRVRAPSATSLIAHLEKKDLVRRIKPQGDKRIVRITLTKKGVLAVQAYLRRSARALETVFERLPEEDVRKLAAILRKLRDAHSKE